MEQNLKESLFVLFNKAKKVGKSLKNMNLTKTWHWIFLSYFLWNKSNSILWNFVHFVFVSLKNYCNLFDLQSINLLS